MIKKILIASTILFLSGCGTRKAETEKTKSEKSGITIENTYTEATKTVLFSSFTFTPFDGHKPMEIEGKKYNNVIISGTKAKSITKNVSIYSKYNITKTINITKTKTTSRTDYTILYLGLFFILCLFLFLWFYLKK